MLMFKYEYNKMFYEDMHDYQFRSNEPHMQTIQRKHEILFTHTT